MDSCPDTLTDSDPCDANPKRKEFADKKCSIITSDVFQDCHALVAPEAYYEDCMFDTCGCDEGGDCECFCSAVEAYAMVSFLFKFSSI